MITSALMTIGSVLLFIVSTVGIYILAGIGLGTGFTVAKAGIAKIQDHKWTGKARSLLKNLRFNSTNSREEAVASGTIAVSNA